MTDLSLSSFSDAIRAARGDLGLDFEPSCPDEVFAASVKYYLKEEQALTETPVPQLWWLPNKSVALKRSHEWMTVDLRGSFWANNGHASIVEFLTELPTDAVPLVSETPFPVVTPESLEAHADWLEKQRGDIGDLRKAAELWRGNDEGRKQAAARRKVLEDLKPGLYEMTATGSGDRTVVVVTAEGALFGRQPEGAVFPDLPGSFPDITELYGKLRKYWSFRALALGDLSPVVTDA